MILSPIANNVEFNVQVDDIAIARIERYGGVDSINLVSAPTAHTRTESGILRMAKHQMQHVLLVEGEVDDARRLSANVLERYIVAYLVNYKYVKKPTIHNPVVIQGVEGLIRTTREDLSNAEFLEFVTKLASDRVMISGDKISISTMSGVVEINKNSTLPASKEVPTVVINQEVRAMTVPDDIVISLDSDSDSDDTVEYVEPIVTSECPKAPRSSFEIPTEPTISNMAVPVSKQLHDMMSSIPNDDDLSEMIHGSIKSEIGKVYSRILRLETRAELTSVYTQLDELAGTMSSGGALHELVSNLRILTKMKMVRHATYHVEVSK